MRQKEGKKAETQRGFLAKKGEMKKFKKKSKKIKKIKKSSKSPRKTA